MPEKYMQNYIVQLYADDKHYPESKTNHQYLYT